MRALPSLAVIIPTKNRPADLEVVVRTVLEQTVTTQHLVIVDQSEGDEGRKQIERLLAEAPARIREDLKLSYIHDTAISGGSAARNRALEVAGCEIQVFLDDDVELEREFLQELLRAYLEDPGVAGVSGIVTNYPLPTRAFRWWTRLFHRGPFHDDRQPVYWNADELRDGKPIRVSRVGGGLMSFRAEAIRGFRFDEELRGVCDGEDVDFSYRLGHSGSLVIAPRARLIHKQSPVGRSRDHWLKRHAQANHFLYKKNWNRGIKNRICYGWLLVGCAAQATLASLRRRSLEPWTALLSGLKDG